MEKQNKRAVVEFTPEQWDAVKIKAKSKGLTVTAYIRMLALDDANA